jgi:hypothetical protein
MEIGVTKCVPAVLRIGGLAFQERKQEYRTRIFIYPLPRLVRLVVHKNPVRFLMLVVAVGFTIAQAAGDPPASGKPSSTLPVFSDTVRFRSFVPESLLTPRAVRRVHVGTGWSAAFANTTGDIVTDLFITFSSSVELTFISPFPDAFPVEDGRTWVVSGQSLAPGEEVIIRGVGPRDGVQIQSWHFGEAPANPGFLPQEQHLLLPMPNSANVRAEVFGLGGFTPGTSESDQLGGMVVGKSFLRYINFRWRIDSDSARLHGWVRMRRQGDLLRSLYDKRRQLVHTGTPRGFCGYDNGRPFLRQVNSLSPLKQNNRLFANLAALKLNIAASQLGITTPGFGELAYHQEGHPLSEVMVREISRMGDSMLTYCNLWSPEVYLMMDSVVQKINGAFSGPIDTVAFGDSLVLSGVRPLSAVSFLTGDPLATPVRLPRVRTPEFSDDDEEGEGSEEDVLPEMIQIAQNFPNPFNPVTAIQFELQEFATVTVKVYDLLGREVETLLDRELLFDGTNEVSFNAAGRASGVYMYRITAEAADGPARTSVLTGKMVLLR